MSLVVFVAQDFLYKPHHTRIFFFSGPNFESSNSTKILSLVKFSKFWFLITICLQRRNKIKRSNKNFYYCIITVEEIKLRGDYYYVYNSHFLFLILYVYYVRGA